MQGHHSCVITKFVEAHMISPVRVYLQAACDTSIPRARVLYSGLCLWIQVGALSTLLCVLRLDTLIFLYRLSGRDKIPRTFVRLCGFIVRSACLLMISSNCSAGERDKASSRAAAGVLKVSSATRLFKVNLRAVPSLRTQQH